ncbi:hypothetical protein RHMOL_Rhmol09G0032300 [Rhododendron molle]|uniref:Uncharacterized protein n=1 Tax=Rhododendron molle TaxID=49168 RepID=A0ACC0MAD2_RHOML|nr:hypothetical protein RHMOL_Rhmol09G0032300 [Rhododendron molle]
MLSGSFYLGGVGRFAGRPRRLNKLDPELCNGDNWESPALGVFGSGKTLFLVCGEGEAAGLGDCKVDGEVNGLLCRGDAEVNGLLCKGDCRVDGEVNGLLCRGDCKVDAKVNGLLCRGDCRVDGEVNGLLCRGDCKVDGEVTGLYCTGGCIDDGEVNELYCTSGCEGERQANGLFGCTPKINDSGGVCIPPFEILSFSTSCCNASLKAVMTM